MTRPWSSVSADGQGLPKEKPLKCAVRCRGLAAPKTSLTVHFDDGMILDADGGHPFT